MSAELALANLPFQIQANTLRTGECSLRISLFFPLFPASLPQVSFSLVPSATTCAVLAEPQESSRKGQAVGRQGTELEAGSRSYPKQGIDPGLKTAKDEERAEGNPRTAALQRDAEEQTGRDTANLRTKLLYSFKCTTLFWIQLTISLAMPSTALASWPLDVPCAPLPAPGRLSGAAKGSARSCLGSKAPRWERSTLQHEPC